MHVSRTAAALALLVLLLGSTADRVWAQQAGRVVGRAVNAQTGEPIPAAQVFLPDLGLGTITDAAGRFALTGVPAGSHTVVAQTLGFKKWTTEGLSVDAARPAALEISLVPSAIELEGLTVSARRESGSNTALLSERRQAAVVVDAIGAEQISASGDGDAAAAMARVPGVSVVDGKYVYVRGLGGRYGNTTLNGATLPSPEPDRKAVPLDIIPSSLLENVVTSKSYSPEQPGDYAGGLVQIRTRDFPSTRLFKVSTSLGYNTAASLREGLGYAGGGLDYLGFDDGTRALPSSVPERRRLDRFSMPAEELASVGRDFVGAWGPTSESLPLNQSSSLSLGDEGELWGRTFGFLGALTHGNRYSNHRDVVERVFSSGGAEDLEVDYGGQTTTHSTTLGALFNASMELGEGRITSATVYNRSVDDEARLLQGYNLDAGAELRNSRIRYLAQTLLNTQLRGEHPFADERVRLSWRGGYSRAERDEPNTREMLYRRAEGGDFLWDDFVQSGSVFHSRLADDGWNAGADLDVSVLTGLRVALGASLDVRDREVYTRRIRFRPDGPLGDSLRALAPNELLSIANVRPGVFRAEEATFATDNYDARQSVRAAYLRAELSPLPRLQLSGGVRVEESQQHVAPRALFDAQTAAQMDRIGEARLDDLDLLPALNVTYALTERMNLRAGLSRTVARPQLRELSPFAFADYVGGSLVVGNSALRRSRISNYDLRWEWFAGADALVALSAFHKTFESPIEVLVFPSTESMRTWVNAGSATTSGIEMELRSSLGAIAPALEPFAINGNVTWVQSEVATGDSVRIALPGSDPSMLRVEDRPRPLQGQSPYVVNVGVSYEHPGAGTTATLLFNRFGRRVEAVGGQAMPEIYEEGRNQLDAVLEQPLGRGYTLKLSGSDLLGSAVEMTQGGDLLRSYDAGRTYSVSLSWEPGR